MHSGLAMRHLQQRLKQLCKKFLPPSLNAKKSRFLVRNSSRNYHVIEPWTVSEMRNVPSFIPKPCYSDTSIPQKGPDEPEVKNKNQIECMRVSCNLAKRVLQNVRTYVEPGITTDELDAIIHEMIVNNGAYPSPLNYKTFPKSVCTSINNVVCHGIPDNRPLENGDIVNIDVTVFFNGYHGDCSEMFQVGECDAEAKRLINVTQLCLDSAIAICKPNEKFCNIGTTIEKIANHHGFNVVPALTGHGIGTYFHGEPTIYHFANNYPGRMQAGMTFTIEPAITEGDQQVEILEDGFTVVSTDNARSAQIEHTVLVTDTGCEILTRC